MNKKIKVLLILSFLFILTLGAAYTYSKYSTAVSGTASADIAKWNITVNDCDIVNPDKNNTSCFSETINTEDNTITLNKNFSITEFTYTNNNNDDVIDTKLAPGSSGTFKLSIKPNDTQVSLKYKLNVSLSKFNSSIKLYRSDPNKNNKVSMEADGYEGILLYSEQGFTFIDDSGVAQDAEQIDFIIYVDWLNDEANNQIDTEIGTSSTSPTFDIPVNILFEQYLG